jgi:hypothetical protein
MYRLLFLLLTSPLYSQHIEYKTYDNFIETQNDTVVSLMMNKDFTLALINDSQFRVSYNSKLYINLHANLYGKSEEALVYMVNPNAFIFINDKYLLFIDTETNTKRYFTKRL